MPSSEAGRPKTGEEVRLQCGFPILLGAKGLFYWIKRTTWIEDTSTGLKRGGIPEYLGLFPQIGADSTLDYIRL